MYVPTRVATCMYSRGWQHVCTHEGGNMCVPTRVATCLYPQGWQHVVSFKYRLLVLAPTPERIVFDLHKVHNLVRYRSWLAV